MDIARRTVCRFEKALAALDDSVKVKNVPASIKQDAVLLRFQLVAELMPKMLKRLLAARGTNVVLPKDIIRQANAGGLITEKLATVLLAVIDDRNRMVHDYNESFAKMLYKRTVTVYLAAFQSLLKTLSRSG